MKVDTFFQNFELLTDAPNALTKLREIIVELAVRGKLVPQISNDESATILIEKIKVEKNKLIPTQKIKKLEILTPVDSENSKLKLPKGWTVEYLINLVLDFQNGFTKRKAEEGKLIPVLRLADIKNGHISEDSLREIPMTSSEIAQYQVREGDILIIRVNGSIDLVGQFIPCLVEREWAYSDHLIRTRIPLNLLEQSYLCLFAKSFEARKHLLGKTVTTAGQKTINQGGLGSLLISVPPLAEQKRIVEKCDRLLSICDEIEKRQQQRQESIVRMNESAIAQLLSSQNPDDFRQHWQRICNNFDLLYSIPETIPKLRQAILQLAVQGKLVRQNPNDESASVLLKKINAEKAKLEINKKSRASKEELLTKYDDAPFQIPSNWLWAKIDDLYDVSGGIQKTPKRTPISNFFPYLRVANVHRRRLDLSQLEYFELLEGELERWKLQSGDLLIVEGNGSENEIGRCAVWNGEIDNCVHQNHIIRARPIGHNSQLFTLLFLNSPSGMAEMRNLAITTSGLFSLSVGKIREILVPLPPLAEQKRIIEKCDRLMSLCDTLEAKLKQGRDSSEKLMEIAAKQVLTA